MKPASPNQLPLDDMPISRDVDINRGRVSLFRALDARFWGKDPSEYADITDDMRRAANPRVLLHDLIYAPNDSTCAVSYVPQGSRQPINVALTPLEYKLIPRSVESFSRSVRNGVLASRPYGESHVRAANRGVLHAHLGKAAAVGTYIDETLVPWNNLLDKLITNADNPRFSHFGTENNFREQFEIFRTNILGNMLDALGTQREWTAEQRMMAFRTIEAVLFIDNDRKMDRVEHFKLLVKSMRRYEHHKVMLFRDRFEKSNEIVTSADAL